MRMVLKVQKHPSGKWIYVSENRHIYFKRTPTAVELAAMGDNEVIYAIFHLENGKSLFLETTKSRDW